MSKLLTIGLAPAALMGLSGCRSSTEQPDTTTTLSPTMDQTTPEPADITSTMAMADSQSEPDKTSIPEFVPTQPVQSLGASSSGLGR